MGVEDRTAVELALSGRMLGDVGHPQLVRCVPGELPCDKITGWALRLFAGRSACVWVLANPWIPSLRIAAFTALGLTVMPYPSRSSAVIVRFP
jgi:hypothetical protein